VVGLLSFGGFNPVYAEDEPTPEEQAIIDSTEEADAAAAKAEAEKLGKSVAALYLIPDFDNPSGESIDVDTRKALINLCAELKIAIFEDNPYGLFYYNNDKKPTMYQLDDKGVVYHLGSFAKTMCPTLRIGYILTPDHESAAQLGKVKSLVSVNTSQFTQAVAGGIILQNDCSLASQVNQAADYYQINRDTMLEALQHSFSDMAGQVSWNEPQGGFFLTVKMPFVFSRSEVKQCAAKYNILCMPRAYFSLDGTPDHYVRLSFSYVTPAQIREGIAALKQFTQDHMAAMKGECDA
ncbi:MAG: PLP-dependent aminotransferase family protein, partial [Algicola sp.]|nr:PLP-dependent aminotransferase family protein [Algicola sp.]